MRQGDIIPWMFGHARTLASLDVGALTIDYHSDLVEGRPGHLIELGGEEFLVPDSWAMPWMMGLSASYGVHIAPTGISRVRCIELLMQGHERKWFVYKGLVWAPPE